MWHIIVKSLSLYRFDGKCFKLFWFLSTEWAETLKCLFLIFFTVRRSNFFRIEIFILYSYRLEFSNNIHLIWDLFHKSYLLLKSWNFEIPKFSKAKLFVLHIKLKPLTVQIFYISACSLPSLYLFKTTS